MFILNQHHPSFLHKIKKLFTPDSNNSTFHFRSIKFEITIIYTLILALILFIFSGMIYFILSTTLYVQLDREIMVKADDITKSIGSYLKTKGDEEKSLQFALEQTIGNEDKRLRRWWYVGFEREWFKQLDEQDLSQDYVNFISPDGESLIHSSKTTGELLMIFQEQAKLAEDNKPLFFYADLNGTKIRVVNVPFIDEKGLMYILQVGTSPAPVIQLLYNWMNRVVLSIPILLLFTSFIGYFLAARILKPVQEITAIANSISHEDLNKRVEVTNFYTEMHSLSESFNDMISRLGGSFEHIEQFSAYMAHEIKTPLTIMKGEAELALLSKRTPAEYQQALKVNLEEIDKVLKIVQDLLFLSHMDYQPGCFNFEKLNFLEYFNEIYEQTQYLTQKKNIKLVYDATKIKNSIYIMADSVHLRRLFFNLIDNAVKFTPVDGRITLKVEQTKTDVKIHIEDTGKGIDSELLLKIFDRFYRVQDSLSGSGLGLSIAQSISKLHGGSLAVQSKIGQGTIFTVTLPLV